MTVDPDDAAADTSAPVGARRARESKQVKHRHHLCELLVCISNAGSSPVSLRHPEHPGTRELIYTPSLFPSLRCLDQLRYKNTSVVLFLLTLYPVCVRLRACLCVCVRGALNSFIFMLVMVYLWNVPLLFCPAVLECFITGRAVGSLGDDDTPDRPHSPGL